MGCASVLFVLSPLIGCSTQKRRVEVPTIVTVQTPGASLASAITIANGLRSQKADTGVLENSRHTTRADYYNVGYVMARVSEPRLENVPGGDVEVTFNVVED